VAPTDGDRVVTITQLVDSGSNASPNDNVTNLSVVSTVDVDPLEAPPVVDLNGVGGGVNYSTTYAENAAGVAIGSGVIVSDPNSGSGDMIESATITLTDRVAGDSLTVTGALPPGIIAVTTPTAGAITIQITGQGTHAQYQALIESIVYASTSEDPTVGGTDLARTVTVTVNDGTADSAVATTTISLTATDDAPVAQPDAFTITESGTIVAGNLFANNGSGADSDPDGPPLAISAVNGSSANVDTPAPFLLLSGASLQVFANGTFNYNPNNAFLPTPTSGSGAANTPAHDMFTYTLAGGNTVTVNITLTGLDTDDYALGTAGADIIDAGAGSDTIDGVSGADTLAGGTGDDFLYVDEDDTVVELAGGGFDNVLARSRYVLGAAAQVEILSTDNHAGTAQINLTGNAFGQVLIGNAGTNVLDGGGGTDRLAGLGGDDFIFVDSADDFVDEAVGGGYDNVMARASYRLNAGAYVEVLSTDNHSGTAAIDLRGNERDNIVIGNAGANILDGGFGGVDRLAGLGGDDVLFVEAGDAVEELAGGGYDNVAARTSYALTFGAHVEVLSTADHLGTQAINLTGNDLDNIVIGNAGENLLDGSFGHDRLDGLGGEDSYAFTTFLSSFNVDTIVEFDGGDGGDAILIDNAVFTGLALGLLDPNAFHLGTAAADADDRIIYDIATGALYFDQDGAGGVAQIQFAILEANPVLTSADITVI
jgi:Ca2+-binding RTX toxin-like protein